MKTNQSINEVQESTYALLVQSEEKERSLFETIVYSLFILSAVAAIGQFALQPVESSARDHASDGIRQAGPSRFAELITRVPAGRGSAARRSTNQFPMAQISAA